MSMLHLRQAYVPPIYVSVPSSPIVEVGQSMAARRRVIARRGAGEQYANVLESPHNPFSHGFPLAFVGDVPADKSALGALKPLTTGEKVLGLAYIAPFLAGPPVVGWLLFGGFGAFAGGLFAAPAIYKVVAELMEPSASTPAVDANKPST